MRGAPRPGNGRVVRPDLPTSMVVAVISALISLASPVHAKSELGNPQLVAPQARIEAPVYGSTKRQQPDQERRRQQQEQEVFPQQSIQQVVQQVFQKRKQQQQERVLQQQRAEKPVKQVTERLERQKMQQRQLQL